MEQQTKDTLPSSPGPAEEDSNNGINSLHPKKRMVPSPRPGELLIYDCRPPPSPSRNNNTQATSTQETGTSLLQDSDVSGSDAAASAQMAFTSPPTTPMPAPQEATFTRVNNSSSTDQGMKHVSVKENQHTFDYFVVDTVAVVFHYHRPPCCSFLGLLVAHTSLLFLSFCVILFTLYPLCSPFPITLLLSPSSLTPLSPSPSFPHTPSYRDLLL
jgi:hypothetical protein